MTDAAASLPTGQDSAAGAAAMPFKLILTALCMAQFINAYDTTAMNVAVTSVVKSLDTTVLGVQSALVLYSLVMASFMLIGGKLGDVWGRRTTFTIGIGMYGCGALITAFSQDLWMMILGWSLLEGLGSALMIPAIFAIIGTAFPAGKPRVSAFAAVGAMAAMGAALGPLVCGFLTTYLTWRISFLLEACVVIATIALSTRIKIAKQPRPPAKLDYLDAALSALGLAIVVLGVLQAGKYGWTVARVPMLAWGRALIPEGGISPVIPFLVVGVVVLILFALWERHMIRAGKDALLNIGMLRKRAVLFGLLAIIAFMFMQAGFLFVTPVFMQMALGYSAFHSGLLILPMTIAIILVAMRVSKLTQIVAPKLIVQTGMLVFVGGIFLVALELKTPAEQWRFLPGMGVAGIGLINAPLMNITQGAVPAKEQSEISGLSRAMSNLGGAFGTAVAGAVLMSTLIATFSGAVEQYSGIPASEKARVVQDLRRDAQTVSNAQVTAYLKSKNELAQLAQTFVQFNQEARNKGLRNAPTAVGVLGLFGFAASCFLPGGKTKKPAAEPEATERPASA
ncbi:MAG TPA: MFS transporter [Thermoleophilia bacterium]|nr:MFS transporter [Thermoleophilia bacterium]